MNLQWFNTRLVLTQQNDLARSTKTEDRSNKDFKSKGILSFDFRLRSLSPKMQKNIQKKTRYQKIDLSFYYQLK